MTEGTVEYVGKDLEAMDFAVNYHRWILELIHPYLGKRIVEVGAGTGSFSEMLLSTGPESLALVEPSKMFVQLEKKVAGLKARVDVRLFHSIFTHAAKEICEVMRPDSILYINVLEHIEDDAAELRAVYSSLDSGGRVIIFVPAIPFLLSKFDREIGHFRRYARKDLKVKLEAAGFKILMLHGFDVLGILPWLVKYRLLGSLKMESSMVNLYDRLAVPLIKPIETILSPRYGKNLLLVAEKA